VLFVTSSRRSPLHMFGRLAMVFFGLGSLMLSAIRSQDQFLVMGGFMMGAIMLLVGNLLAEILLAVADPRISYS
jgi:ABC-type dipeptide/oligopeptide/nickel transport system permease component